MLEPMLNNHEELQFLISFLRRDMTVLEFGSGGSTLEIAKHVKQVYSVEHDEIWFNKVANELPENARIYHIPRNSPEAIGDDGTEAEYADYIEKPLLFGIKPNLVFIDGRCRVGSAKTAVKILADDGIVLIHDYHHPQNEYRRYDLEVVEDFLEPIDHVFALWAFKPKRV